jgi:hypothetical protein
MDTAISTVYRTMVKAARYAPISQPSQNPIAQKTAFGSHAAHGIPRIGGPVLIVNLLPDFLLLKI